VAVAHALSVLGWLELSEEDRPPEEIWLDAELVNAHFEVVSERYKNESAGMETVPEAEMTENELTKGLRG
jgi:hypothetical protein